MSEFGAESIAALTFLVLYGILFLLLTIHVFPSLGFRSVYTFLFFHTIVRLSALGCGIGSGLVGYSNVSFLLAFFTLGVQGHFTLILCAYLFLVNWRYIEAGKKLNVYLKWAFHLLLTTSNVVAIVGWSELSSIKGKDINAPDVLHTRDRAKNLRVGGQAVFLVVSIIILFFTILEMQNYKRRQAETRESKAGVGVTAGGVSSAPKLWFGVHRTLWLMLGAFQLLIVRGAYGILEDILSNFDMFNLDNYEDGRLKATFVSSQYLFSVFMEWGSCRLLLATFWTSFIRRERGVIASV